MRQKLTKALAFAGAAIFAAGTAVTGTAPAADAADGINGEVRGYVWPGGNGIPNWEGTYRMPDGSEAWCAEIWQPEPKYADAYGDPVPLTMNNGASLGDARTKELAYIISTASDKVLNKSGKEADDYAAATAVIVHDWTNSNKNQYNPEWPFAAFDAGTDPVGTGQNARDVRSVANRMMDEAKVLSGPWALDLEADEQNLVIGDTVTVTGKLTRANGSQPVPNKEIYLNATGAELSSASVMTDANGTFSLSALVMAENIEISAKRLAPATTVMMRKPTSWQGSSRPQNMILVDDNEIRDVVKLVATTPEKPSIGTSATDQADGDKLIAWDGGTVIDVVAYKNLTPGQKYTVTGELMDKATGKGTGITGEAAFTAEKADGTVNVEFVIPKGFAGTTLVAFEKLFDINGEIVATHEDINDKEQTVVVEEEPEIPVVPTEPEEPVVPEEPKKPTPPLANTGFTALAVGLGSLVLLAFGAMLLTTTRRSYASDE